MPNVLLKLRQVENLQCDLLGSLRFIDPVADGQVGREGCRILFGKSICFVIDHLLSGDGRRADRRVPIASQIAEPAGGSGSCWGNAKQKQRLETKLQREHLLLGQLPPLSVQILELAKSRGQVTIRDIVTITGANRNMVKKPLENLVIGGQLHKHGVGKGTFYTR